jgi:hypothetical protein
MREGTAVLPSYAPRSEMLGFDKRLEPIKLGNARLNGFQFCVSNKNDPPLRNDLSQQGVAWSAWDGVEAEARLARGKGSDALACQLGAADLRMMKRVPA